MRKVENVGQGGTSDTQLGHDGHDTPAHGLNSMPDHELVKQIAKGEQAAFSVMVYRYTDKYLSIAERVLKNREEAEDAIQEAFVKLWEKAHSFNEAKAKFSTWFYRLVLNHCLDKKRKKQHLQLADGFEKEDESPNQEQVFDEKQKAKKVREHLDQLPEKQKAAIIMCYFEGLTNKEAAEVLDINIKALESLLSRGRKNLEQKLAKQATNLLETL